MKFYLKSTLKIYLKLHFYPNKMPATANKPASKFAHQQTVTEKMLLK
jgi:hypothetical protein